MESKIVEVTITAKIKLEVRDDHTRPTSWNFRKKLKEALCDADDTRLIVKHHMVDVKDFELQWPPLEVKELP